MLDPVLSDDRAAPRPEGAVHLPPAAAAAASGAPRHYGLAAGALILLALIWGYTWPLMKSVLTYADPFVYAAMRTLIAGLLLIAVLPLFRRPVRPKAVASRLCWACYRRPASWGS